MESLQPGQDKTTTFLNEDGSSADIDALRRIHPALLTLETWARQNGWETPNRRPRLA